MGGPRRVAVLAVVVLIATTSVAPARAAEPATAIERAVTARLAVSPLEVRLELDRASAPVGTSTKARVHVLNAGPVTVRQVEASLRVDAAAITVKGTRATIGLLPPGRTSTVSWTLCGRAPGSYVVLAQAVLDGVVVESPATVLTITTGSGKAKC